LVLALLLFFSVTRGRSFSSVPPHPPRWESADFSDYFEKPRFFQRLLAQSVAGSPLGENLPHRLGVEKDESGR
jgi:hypothetical protein